jgi:hypothetical protein
VVLVEAKSHLPEFASPPSAAAGISRLRISDSLRRVRLALGADACADWTMIRYQYANRLAHLWWLRAQGIDARLLLVGFLGDAEMRGPESAEAWHAAYREADAALGLPADNPLAPYVLHVHPRVPFAGARPPG